MIENITQPKAVAILYMKHNESYGFSDRELFSFISFLIVPAFFDILVCKYENHIEFMIHVAKTDNEFVKRINTRAFHSIIENMSGVIYESLTNNYKVEENYDCLTAKCMLDGVHK